MPSSLSDVRIVGYKSAALLLTLSLLLQPQARASDAQAPAREAPPPQTSADTPRPAPTDAQLALLKRLFNRYDALVKVSKSVAGVSGTLNALSEQHKLLTALLQTPHPDPLGAGSEYARFQACSDPIITQVGALDALLQRLIDLEQASGEQQRAIAMLGAARNTALKHRIEQQTLAQAQREAMLTETQQRLLRLQAQARQCNADYEAMVDSWQERQPRIEQVRMQLNAFRRSFDAMQTALNRLIATLTDLRETEWPSLRADQIPASLPSQPTQPEKDQRNLWLASLLQQHSQAHKALDRLAAAKLAHASFWPDLQRAPTEGPALLDDLLQVIAAQNYVQAASPQDWARCQGQACQAWRKERKHVTAELARRQALWDTWRQRMLQTGKTAKAPAQSAGAVLQDEAQQWHQVELSMQQMTSASAQIADVVAEDLRRFNADLDNEIRAAWSAYIQAFKQIYGESYLATGESSARQGREPPPVTMTAPAPSASAPSAMQPPFRIIEDHSHQRITKLDQEYAGFGTYTYVLLRSQDDWAKPKVRERVTRLIGYLATTTPEGGSIAPVNRPRYNLFVLPTDAKQSYNSLLGHELKARIRSGLMLQPAIRDALLKQPGPFLLTLPTTVKKMSPDSALVFADLSTVPMQTIQDVAKQYMNGLVASLPTDQKRWKPPAKLGFAMTLISLADDASGFAFHLFPGGEAMAKGR